MAIRFLALVLLFPTALLADVWISDSNGSFGFEATFEGDPLPGDFTDFNVSWSDEALTVTVNLAGSDMGDGEMNAILHDPTWLAVEQFATAVFSAAKVSCDDSACLASGELELKGAKQAIDVPFTWAEDGDSATMRGELSLDRTGFDVGSGEWASGDSIGVDVELRFDINLKRTP
ncbi:MAG: YceI family protein [Woeseiaceae bacterium]|nr:YceI family protein [Woeseiaceae bacterium]